jgi:outer membrane protein assembly factor BamB
VVTGTAVFIGSCAGTFYAFNKQTGQTLWTYNIKQDGNQSSFHGNILICGSLVVVGTDRGSDPTAEGHIYAFDAATGKPAWKYSAGTGVSADLLLDDSRLIAYAANGELLALDLRSGTPIWKRRITEPNPDRYLSSPVLVDHTVFAATTNSSVTAVRATDGEVLWRRQLEPSGYLQIMDISGELYLLSSARYIYRLNRRTGRVTEKKELPASPYFVPSRIKDSFVVQLSDHTVRRISKHGIRWTATADGELTTHKPLVLQNEVVVADATGRVAAWRLEDGAPQWSTVFHHLKEPVTTIGADSDMLYVGTQDGTLRAISFRELRSKD